MDIRLSVCPPGFTSIVRALKICAHERESEREEREIEREMERERESYREREKISCVVVCRG